MLINRLVGGARRPRLRVVANGAILTSAIHARVISTAYYAADSFSVTLPINAGPFTGADYWSSSGSNEIAVEFSIDGGMTFMTAIEGLVDRLVLDPICGTAVLEGRDFTSYFVDTILREQYLNRSASEIAQTFAEGHGLAPSVTPTSRLVGRYYQGNRTRTTLSRDTTCTTEWDLLVALARFEDFEVFVQGRSLFFQPRPLAPRVVFGIDPSVLCALKMEYLPSITDAFEVKVQSWNSERQSPVTSVASSNSSIQTGVTSGTGVPSKSYVITRPNLTIEEAELMAAQALREIQLHRKIISLEMPGDTVLTPRQGIQLGGTGAMFDQVYLVESVERSFAPGTGFIQHVRAVDI